ncbi:unnamed protein product [Rotaria sp. Silwood1]|nr:unnamed protein product [Rotaria sp. Silwood1]CAF3712147.1 unnamed protein product [Rotaria sp. Silwood1]CAF3742972.1 unnamed protein product [Rotaria sp. Silwood1]CAF3770052.1 unnamed protein product [Rotaria sp. Silwood1]CAF4679547.1 unnamed protein product [Rotaria sp. Silwood1]
MNALETTIKFTVEVQANNKLPFLDAMIKRQENILITYVYYKSTDTGLCLKWVSNQPKLYKINLIKCLCNRAIRICSSAVLLKKELDYYKKIFLANGYPHNVIKNTMKTFELNKHNNNNNNNNNNRQQQKTNAQTIYISMPFHNDFSIQLAKNIKRILDLPNKKIMFGFKSQTRLCSLFNTTYRDKKKTK